MKLVYYLQCVLRNHIEICLLTIYRLPFQVSGRVSDGLILDSFSQ